MGHVGKNRQLQKHNIRVQIVDLFRFDIYRLIDCVCWRPEIEAETEFPALYQPGIQGNESCFVISEKRGSNHSFLSCKEISVADVMDMAVGEPMPYHVRVEQVAMLPPVADQQMSATVGSVVAQYFLVIQGEPLFDDLIIVGESGLVKTHHV